MSVHQYDVVLDVLVVNQTDDTLQHCTLELATLGELRLVERPAGVVLAPRDFTTIRAHVKVASTENGIIFGNIGKLCLSLCSFIIMFCIMLPPSLDFYAFTQTPRAEKSE